MSLLVVEYCTVLQWITACYKPLPTIIMLCAY